MEIRAYRASIKGCGEYQGCSHRKHAPLIPSHADFDRRPARIPSDVVKAHAPVVPAVPKGVKKDRTTG